MRLATGKVPMMGLRLKGALSMRPANHHHHLNPAELIERAERWPVPVVVLVTTCLIMTAAAVWA
jgi:hypothetical protein